MQKLVRKEVKLQALNDSVLPYNYNYKLMQVLFKSLEMVNPEKTRLLHDEGFKIGTARFKLFNFYLYIENSTKKTFLKDGIKIEKGSYIKIILSGAEYVVKDMLKGIVFMDQIQLFSSKFQINSFKELKKVRFNKTMLYKAVGPVVESTYRGKLEYLTPMDNLYYINLAKNLIKKYELVYDQKYDDEINFDIANGLFKKKVIRGIHDKPENIKRGYSFDIWMIATPKMQGIAYYLGLGQANSLGAGFLKYISHPSFCCDYSDRDVG